MVSVPSTLIAPRQEPSMAVIFVACFFGLAFGYGQLSAERIRGTQGYLAHREGGRAALLRSKIAVGIPLVLALAMLPPLVGCAWQLFGPLAAVVQPARAFEHALAGLAALPAYACGLFIALVASNVLVMLFLALVAVFGCFLYSMWLPLPVFQVSFWAIPLYAAGQALLGAALLALAWRVFARGHDRDGVLPFRLQAGSLLFALLLFVFPIHAIVCDAVRSVQLQVFDGYPLIVRSFDGRYSLMERREYESRIRAPGTEKTTFTMPDGTVASESNPSMVYNPSPPIEVPRRLRIGTGFVDPLGLASSQRWTALPFNRHAPRPVEIADKDGRALRTSPEEYYEAYFDRETGVVRQYFDIALERSGPVGQRSSRFHWHELVLRRSDDKLLSRATVLTTDGMQTPLLIDCADKTLWTLDFAEQGTRLAQLSLPNGERLVDVQPQQGWWPAGWSGNIWREFVLVGEKGRYQWTSSGFQLEGSPATRPFWLRHCRSEWGEPGLTAMTVRLRATDASGAAGPDSEIVYVQRYEPRTALDNAVTLLMRLGMQSGPPILSAQRLLFGSNESLTLGFLPWFYGMPADAFGFQLVHVLLGLALGALAWLRVARRGGARAERVLWGVLVALFGAFALLFLALLAPRPRRESANVAIPVPATRHASTLATT
jgi:hypothetical protein